MGEDDFRQTVDFENVPPYCRHCWHLGHSELQCHVHNPELRVTRSNSSQKTVPDGMPKKTVLAPQKTAARLQQQPEKTRSQLCTQRPDIAPAVVPPSQSVGNFSKLNVVAPGNQFSVVAPGNQFSVVVAPSVDAVVDIPDAVVEHPDIVVPVVNQSGAVNNLGSAVVDQSIVVEQSAVIVPPVQDYSVFGNIVEQSVGLISDPPALDQPVLVVDLTQYANQFVNVDEVAKVDAQNLSVDGISIPDVVKLSATVDVESQNLVPPVHLSVENELTASPSVHPSAGLKNDATVAVVIHENTISEPQSAAAVIPSHPSAAVVISESPSHPSAAVVISETQSPTANKRQEEFFPTIQTVSQVIQDTSLNVNAISWYPPAPNQPLVGTTESSHYRAYEDNFLLGEKNEDSDFNDEDNEDENDSYEDFMDSQSVRDDIYLEKRRNRHVQRERDALSAQFRRGRGRPPGFRNCTYFDLVRTVNTRSTTSD